MRHSNRFLNTILALGVVGALTLGTVSQAGESKQAAPSPAAKVHQSTDLTMKRGAVRTGKHEIRETISFTFEKIERPFNPKEITVDKSVPWQK